MNKTIIYISLKVILTLAFGYLLYLGTKKPEDIV